MKLLEISHGLRVTDPCINFGSSTLRLLLVMLKILHDLSILGYHYSQGVRYLGPCRIVRIHCGFPEPLKLPLLGGPWDLVTTYSWAYNPTYSPPKWT